jgi:hypothetical protein
MTILTEPVDEVFPGWISSKTLEPHNYWSRSLIEACDTILECAGDALQHRILKKIYQKEFFPRYSAIGREVFQCSHYYRNILRIGDIGLPSFLTHLWAMLDETYTFQRVVQVYRGELWKTQRWVHLRIPKNTCSGTEKLSNY